MKNLHRDDTELKFVKDLTKGMIVCFYRCLFEITEAPVEYPEDGESAGSIYNAWVAPCKIVNPEEDTDWLLKTMNTFQANSISKACKYAVVKPSVKGGRNITKAIMSGAAWCTGEEALEEARKISKDFTLDSAPCWGVTSYTFRYTHDTITVFYNPS